MSKSNILLSILGVILPATALIVEASTGICARGIFDPIPTRVHFLLVAFVPVGNLILLLRLSSKSFQPNFFDYFTVSLVLSISAIYSVVFSPVIIPSLPLSIWFGLGLLPLTPMASLVASLILLRTIFKVQSKKGAYQKSIWASGSFGAIFCCMVGMLWGVVGGENFVFNLFPHQLF